MKNNELLNSPVSSPRVMAYIASVVTAMIGSDIAQSLAGQRGLIFFVISGIILFSLGALTQKVSS